MTCYQTNLQPSIVGLRVDLQIIEFVKPPSPSEPRLHLDLWSCKGHLWRDRLEGRRSEKYCRSVRSFVVERDTSVAKNCAKKHAGLCPFKWPSANVHPGVRFVTHLHVGKMSEDCFELAQFA